MRPTQVHPLSIRDSLAGKHVLVTGVTGFLGKVWVLSLIEHVPDIGRITVVVRGRRGESAVARTEREWGVSPALRPLRQAHGKGVAERIAAKVQVLPGDIAQPGSGIDPQAVEALRGSVDLVVHFAGMTDFQPDPVQALAINTRGAMNVADVAAALAVPMVHVSTAYVAGRASGRIAEQLDPRTSPLGVRFDPESEVAALEARLAALPKNRAALQQRIDVAMARAEALGWPNIYTFSKALGERLLALRDDVDVTIVRPTIVECARAFPFAGWNEGLNTSAPLAWLISTAFRDFPSREHNLFDIAPVDLVSRGMTLVAAAALEGKAGGVFHLGTSGSNPVTFGRIIELTGLANRRRLRDDPTASPWRRLVIANLDPVPVDADRRPLWHVSRLRKGARAANRLLRDLKDRDLPGPLDELAGDAVERWTQRGLRTTNNAVRDLGRIEGMLELFQPFVHDQDYLFENDRVRALSAGLPADERADFAWDDDSIDWRDYWYNVEYPGLWKWSIPLLDGDRAPVDTPLDPPLSLRHAAARQLVASGEPTR
jgi:long-chain acyl-CoA synthetase